MDGMKIQLGCNKNSGFYEYYHVVGKIECGILVERCREWVGDHSIKSVWSIRYNILIEECCLESIVNP